LRSAWGRQRIREPAADQGRWWSLGPAEPVGDLLALHEAAGIQLRLVANLWAVMDEIGASTLRFSGIRLRHAKPRM
jgi:hypothetical protein